MRRIGRGLHTVPKLPAGSRLQEHGLGRLYSPAGFAMAWTQYQAALIADINLQVEGTEREHMLLHNVVIETAARPEESTLYNVASQACNNHFYFSTLAERGVPMGRNLQREIQGTFDTIDLFKDTMLGTALGMFGNGWVWAVRDQARKVQVLATYNSGSPYDVTRITANATRSRGQLGPKRPAEGLLEPLVVINTWEHAWLHDYGILGKEKFLHDWWDHVDWELAASGLFNKVSEQQRLVYP